MENRSDRPHALTVDSRSSAQATGVVEVLGFTDSELVLSTSLGSLSVKGSELKIVKFNQADGSLAFSGKINSIAYAAPKQSIIKRLFK